ncbi:MAG TPA: hypothetical protein VJT31_41395 [Rugosimonospora sp.]|nr:hypothetical protein [Rugosimonospora sp.]
MGTLRGDNGGERPSEGGGLPDLPPEWGTIVIPDDAAALEHEAELVRKELRRQARRNRWRLRFGLPALAPGSGDGDTPALGLPLLIMSIAIIATLTSLFAIAWPTRAVQSSPSPQTTAQVNAAPSTPPVPDLTLRDGAGTALRLRSALPAVILLVDGCSCGSLIIETARAVGPAVTVLAVARTAPPLPSELPAGRTVRAAADEHGTLRTMYGGGTPGTAVGAILVRSTGEVITALRDVRTVDSFRAYLGLLS